MLHAECISKVQYLKKEVNFIKKSIDIDNKKKQIQDLKKISEKNDFWNNQKDAIKTTKLISLYEQEIKKIEYLENKLNEINELIDLFNEESNEYKEIACDILNLETVIQKNKIECMFKDDIDKNNCFIDINPGAGGTESQDWVNMLSNMYIKWGERNNYKVDIINKIDGDEAGIKTISLKITNKSNHKADYAFGFLKFETGIHRLVRISPFNSNAKRHTSFASVSVYPEIEVDINIVIDEKDIRIDTYRASGAGGQHVNTTDSAIRITHIPSGIVVQCQNERSQHKNKDSAMKMLKSKLYQLELAKAEEKKNANHQNKKDISWGNQKRSYVLHPYKMIKDLVTEKETFKVKDFLEGYINDFLYYSVEFHSISSNN